MNKETILKEVTSIFENTKKDIKVIEEMAISKNIYTRIDEGQVIENRITEKFPFMSLGNFNMVNYWGNPEKLSEDILSNFLNKENKVLREIRFISLKGDIAKFKPEYSLNLYLLNRVGDFGELKEGSYFEILKEYKNGSVDVRFLNEKLLKKFSDLVYYENEQTKTILNNLSDEFKQKFKEAKKKICFNEISLIYELARDLNIGRVNFNKYLIIKEILK